MISNAMSHRQVWDLLPWMANGSTSADEQSAIEAHLQSCGECRAELAFQRSLREQLLERSAPGLDAEAGWQRLVMRLDGVAGEMGERQQSGPRRTLRAGWTPWLVAAMILEALGLGAMGAALWTAHGRPGESASLYRTLGASAAATPAPTLRVVFAPSMTLSQLLALLGKTQLIVVGGPSPAGVWSLAPLGANPQPTAVSLRQLRGRPEVRFAEPLDAPP